MKVVVVATRSNKFTDEEFAPLLPAEAKKALQLVAEDVVREIYSRQDGRGAILVLEAESEEAAHAHLATLPLAEAGMLDFDVYPVKAYRAIAAAAEA
jgi:hypothetical protein